MSPTSSSIRQSCRGAVLFALGIAACSDPDDPEFDDAADFEETETGGLDDGDEQTSTGGPSFAPDVELELAPGDEDPEAITTSGTWSWGTPGNNGPWLDLGTDSNRTCFLMGVTGALRGKWKGTRARVSVFRSGGRWWLRTVAGTDGPGVMGHATCIPTANNRRVISWVGNTQDSNNTLYSWVEDTGSTRCFMTSVSGSVGWGSPNSYARLQKQTIYGFGTPFPGWTLKGNLLKEQDGTSGGSAAAVCVDISFQTLKTYDHASYGATGWIMPSSGTTCGVERLAGNFAYPAGGWWDGARLLLDWGIGWWKVTSEDAKRISGTCYKNWIWFPFP